MEHFGDLLVQLMKHGTNTLHVAFIFLFSVSNKKKEANTSDRALCFVVGEGF